MKTIFDLGRLWSWFCAQGSRLHVTMVIVCCVEWSCSSITFYYHCGNSFCIVEGNFDLSVN